VFRATIGRRVANNVCPTYTVFRRDANTRPPTHRCRASILPKTRAFLIHRPRGRRGSLPTRAVIEYTLFSSTTLFRNYRPRRSNLRESPTVGYGPCRRTRVPFPPSRTPFAREPYRNNNNNVRRRIRYYYNITYEKRENAFAIIIISGGYFEVFSSARRFLPQRGG